MPQSVSFAVNHEMYMFKIIKIFIRLNSKHTTFLGSS